MHCITPDTVSYSTFTDILTGYRQAALIHTAHQAGLFVCIGAKGAELSKICRETGWEPQATARFLEALRASGFIEKEEEYFRLTPFSETFLHPGSEHYQGQVLAFEQQLVQSWESLGETLCAGQRTHGLEDKNEAELESAYGTYLGAMDEAAGIRCGELWDQVHPGPEGTILDIGAGSGRFLSEFLTRHDSWQGVFCDLDNVIARAAEAADLIPIRDRIRFVPCNFLDPLQSQMEAIKPGSCDLVLLSNVVHCQGAEETAGLLENAAKKISADGMLLIHDFFTDSPPHGPLYDLHMLLNTYNGRTYTHRELADMAAGSGLQATTRKPLASGSELIAFGFTRQGLEMVS